MLAHEEGKLLLLQAVSQSPAVEKVSRDENDNSKNNLKRKWILVARSGRVLGVGAGAGAGALGRGRVEES